MSGLETLDKRQSQDFILCAFHTAKASCQVTEGFSSEGGEIVKLSWAGRLKGASPSFGPPIIIKHLLFEKHYSEQDREDPCLGGACGGGLKEMGERGTGERTLQVYDSFS